MNIKCPNCGEELVRSDTILHRSVCGKFVCLDYAELGCSDCVTLVEDAGGNEVTGRCQFCGAEDVMLYAVNGKICGCEKCVHETPCTEWYENQEIPNPREDY